MIHLHGVPNISESQLSAVRDYLKFETVRLEKERSPWLANATRREHQAWGWRPGDTPYLTTSEYDELHRKNLIRA